MDFPAQTTDIGIVAVIPAVPDAMISTPSAAKRQSLQKGPMTSLDLDQHVVQHAVQHSPATRRAPERCTTLATP
eukprot:350077-Chlamydomonas_euryale.AAC.1